MTLHEHDGDYMIRVDGRELMSTRHHHSEDQLALVACTRLYERQNVRVLIGGLGLGFTLRAALGALGPAAEVVVAELMPEIVAWNRNQTYALASKELEDPRTRLEIADVYDVIALGARKFDAIMLDADNGTTAMSTEGNQKLYKRDGIARVHGALKPGGYVVYWSAQDEPLFAKLLGKSGFKVDVQRVRAHATSGAGGMHTLLVARRL